MLNRSLTLPLFLCAAIAAVSCGSVAPVAPTPSVVTGLTLSLNTPGIGSTVQAAGVVALSSGNTVTIGTGYSSDTPSVATVTSSGAVTGISLGDATIAVEYQGFRATKKIRVLPSYSGVFSGTFVVNTCTNTGGYSDGGFCTSNPVGTVGSIAFSNVQSADLTTLSGLIQLGTATPGTGSGTISSTTGALSYTGSIVASTTTIAVQNFAMTSPSVGHLTGTFQLQFTDSTISGMGIVTCTMADAARSSASIASAPARAGLAAHVPADPIALARAVLQR